MFLSAYFIFIFVCQQADSASSYYTCNSSVGNRTSSGEASLKGSSANYTSSTSNATNLTSKTGTHQEHSVSDWIFNIRVISRRNTQCLISRLVTLAMETSWTSALNIPFLWYVWIRRTTWTTSISNTAAPTMIRQAPPTTPQWWVHRQKIALVSVPNDSYIFVRNRNPTQIVQSSRIRVCRVVKAS